MNRKVYLLAGAVLLSSITGCADRAVNQANYNAYLAKSDARMTQYYAALKANPLVDITLPGPNGEEYHIKVAQQVKLVTPQQIKDDESLAFWGKVLPASIYGLTSFGTSWVNNHYRSKDNEAMWAAIGDMGSGVTLDSGGGDLTLTDSANPFMASLTGDGNGFGYQAYKSSPLSGGEGPFSPALALTPTSTNNPSYNQAGGEDSNLIQ